MERFLKVVVLVVGVFVVQAAFAVDYYWTINGVSGSFSSAYAACEAYANEPRSYQTRVDGLHFNSATWGVCELSETRYGGWSSSTTSTYRYGNSCPPNTEYNPSTGGCDAPFSCPETDIYVAVECTYNESLKLWDCPSEISKDGCGFVVSPNGKTRCDSSLSYCAGRYTGTGEAASPGLSQCTESTCPAAPATPTPSEPACATYEGTSICITDENTGCGTINGVEGCFTPEKNCGTYNGTFGCYPQDKPNRNCGYANGQQVCFDPNNPTVQIPSTSPDHPVNGGNADGNQNNDPKDPADTSGTASSQGSNSGATNESIGQLGENLGAKIDKTNSLLDAIKGLLGVEYDSSAEWSDADANSVGTALGDWMVPPLENAVDDAITARDAEVQTAISGVPGTVESWFADIPGIHSLGGFFPVASGCSDYQIPINAMGFSFVVTLPVCFLSRFKELIEWVLWCLTAIGVWNIFYSGLRLENTKASKGGY